MSRFGPYSNFRRDDAYIGFSRDGELRETDLDVAEVLGDEDGVARDELNGTIAEAVESAIVPGADIVCAGDSLTAGAGSSGGNTYPAVLQGIINDNYSDPGVVRNLGVGGETSATIAGRVSIGAPWLATISGGIIPASGAVAISLVGNDGAAVAPLVQGSAGVNPVQIAGIEGTLSLTTGIYYFTRTNSGAATVAPRPLPVTTAAARDRVDDIHITWMGQNDGTTDPTAIVARTRAVVAETSAPSKRYLAIGLSTGSSATRDTMDAALLQAFGRRLFNPRTYLARTEALLEAGLLPTIADETAIRAGSVPPAFLVDGTHFNNLGYARQARGVFERLVELGYDDRWGTKSLYTFAPLASVLVFDDFEGADGSSILSAKPKIGAVNWTTGGTAACLRQSGALTIAITSGGEAQCLTSAGVSNYRLRTTVRTRGALQRPKILVRFTDQNNYHWIDGPGTLGGVYRFRSKVAGALAAVDLAVSPADGDVWDITCNGNAITCVLNGVSVYTTTTILTGQQVGFMAYNGTASNEASYENILVSAV